MHGIVAIAELQTLTGASDVTRQPFAWWSPGAVDCRCSHAPADDVAPVVTVDVAPVLLSTIQQTVRVDAIVYPRQQSALVSQDRPPIRRGHVKRGDRVKAGQALVELESQDFAGAAALRAGQPPISRTPTTRRHRARRCRRNFREPNSTFAPRRMR